MTIHDTRGRGKSALFGLGLALAAAAAIAPGCSDDTGTGGTGTTTSSNTGGGETGGSPATTTNTVTTGNGGGGGGTVYSCTTTAPHETRGSAIAISPDDSIAVVANRDSGSVSVFDIDYTDGLPALTKTAEISTGADSEPWQVAIDGCGTRAYVILRKDQRVVAIDSLDTTPVLGDEAAVGSEPTGLLVSPNNTAVYVANWVEGTVSVVDPATMTVTDTVDLNATLIATTLLGTGLTTRPALAHPRSIAMTNDGDADDADETIVAAEYFAQRIAPEGANGANADVAKKGLIYRINAGTLAATTADLPNVPNTGFNDHTNAATGCYPNQVNSVTVKGAFAYVTSTCASPKGQLGVFQPSPNTCALDSDCGALGGDCCQLATDPGCSAATVLTCRPNTTNVKTTTHPALSIVDIGSGTGTTTVLDALFDAPAVDSARMPLLPTDIGFFNNFAYLTAMGSDAVFKLTLDGTGANIMSVGSTTPLVDFINLRKDASDTVIKLPVGIATANGASAFAFVATEGSYEISALNLSMQAIAGVFGVDQRIALSTALPAANSAAEDNLKGKRFFNTGLGRWSLGGEGWGACAVCHIDGLSDNISWYFPRGPRQSVSLDGSFATGDPTDQRIFNWTGIFDEVADFELNTRGVSGGLGAIVDGSNARIDLTSFNPPQQGLQGSTANVPGSTLQDWDEIEVWIQGLRSPRRPVGLVAADVAAGKTLFTTVAQGNCIACHSGPKWTISKLFYTPGNLPNAATADTAATSLGTQDWFIGGVNGFPASLFPVTGAPGTNARMRLGAPPANEQIQCMMRNTLTFGQSPAAVGIAEVRVNMSTAAQGGTSPHLGYNPPSLLGAQVGAPFFHGGNARTLEELFDQTLFVGHHASAVASVFNPSSGTGDQKRQLVAYILSLDEEVPAADIVAIPAKSANGGNLCFYIP